MVKKESRKEWCPLCPFHCFQEVLRESEPHARTKRFLEPELSLSSICSSLAWRFLPPLFGASLPGLSPGTLPQHPTNRSKGINRLTSCWLITITMSCTQILPLARKGQQRAFLKPAFLPYSLPKALDHSLGSLLFDYHLPSVSFQEINEV